MRMSKMMDGRRTPTISILLLRLQTHHTLRLTYLLPRLTQIATEV